MSTHAAAIGEAFKISNNRNWRKALGRGLSNMTYVQNWYGNRVTRCSRKGVKGRKKLVRKTEVVFLRDWGTAVREQPVAKKNAE